MTDSFSPVIDALDPRGQPRVLVRDARFAGEGINLSGLVVHPDRYLLMVKKSDGALFKVPLARPEQLSAVALDAPLLAGDGLLLTSPGELVVVANQVTGASECSVGATREDGWASAGMAGSSRWARCTRPLSRRAPLVLHSKLDRLLNAAPDEQAALDVRAMLESIEPQGARLVLRTASQASPGAPVASEAQRETRQRQPLPSDPAKSCGCTATSPRAPLRAHRAQCVGCVLEGSFESPFEHEPPDREADGQVLGRRASGPLAPETATQRGRCGSSSQGRPHGCAPVLAAAGPSARSGSWGEPEGRSPLKRRFGGRPRCLNSDIAAFLTRCYRRALLGSGQVCPHAPP